MSAASEPSEPHWNGRRLKRRRLKLESGELRCECILTHELLAWGGLINPAATSCDLAKGQR